MDYPEVPESIFNYILNAYGYAMTYDNALYDFLEDYRLSNEQKENLTEKELEDNRDLKNSIKKQAFEELHGYLNELKKIRRLLKEYKDDDNTSDELREEIEEILEAYSYTIQDLGELSAPAIFKTVEVFEQELYDIADKYKEENLEEQLEEEERAQEELDYQNMRGTYEPQNKQEQIEEYQEMEKEYQPYEFQLQQVPGYSNQRDVFPSALAYDRPVVNETAERDIEYYQSQILRLQQLMLSDPQNEHNEYYSQLLGLLRQKIQENQDIVHDHVNYHIGPSEISGEMDDPEDEDNILINRPMTYHNMLNRRMFNMEKDNLRQDEDIQRRTNKMYLDGKYQFAPQKGFRPYVSRELWESMTEGQAVGWATAYAGDIQDYNNGIYGNRFLRT